MDSKVAASEHDQAFAIGEACRIGRQAARCLRRLEQLRSGEPLPELRKHLREELAVDPQLTTFALKPGILERSIDVALGLDNPARRFAKVDLEIGGDRAAAEGDRRDVALTNGAQAEHETQGAVGQIGLVRAGDDARVEEGGRFERVFLAEIGTDQQLARLTQFGVTRQPVGNILEPAHKVPVKPRMPPIEIIADLTPLQGHFLFGHREDPSDDLERAGQVSRGARREFRRRHEWANQHPSWVRAQDQR